MQWLTLFWLTQSFPTSIYMYRHIATLGDFTRSPTSEEAKDFTKPLSGLKVGKKIGYSTFPKEIFPVPKVWAEQTGDLVFYRLNKEGTSGSGWESGVLMRYVRRTLCRTREPRVAREGFRRVPGDRMAKAD
jgi:hypothetical protein